MRRLAIVLVLFAACDREPASSSGSSVPRSSSAEAPRGTEAPRNSEEPALERGVFTVILNNEEILREEFERSGSSLRTFLSSNRMVDRAVLEVTLGPDATVSRASLSVAGATPGAGPRLILQSAGTQATVERSDGKLVHRETLVVPASAILMPANESIAMLEQIVRRARAIGGNEVSVPIVPKSLQPQMVKVTFRGADRARVETPDSLLEVQTDAEGRVLAAVEPRQKLTIRRG